MTVAPAISICIPAYNEAQLIGRTIRALNAAIAELDRPCEIVVADDASSDDTAAIARDAGARVVTVEHRKISASRNSAAAAATGDILIFVDADTVIEPHHLREALSLLESGCIGGGALVTFDGRIPLWSRIMLGMMIAGYGLAQYSAGCFMFCTREAFETVGGYPEAYYGGEEVKFAKSLKRIGRFRLIRSRVMTSGRKLRAYRAREILAVFARAFTQGPDRMARRRESLDIWYEDRRDDPWYREGGV